MGNAESKDEEVNFDDKKFEYYSRKVKKLREDAKVHQSHAALLTTLEIPWKTCEVANKASVQPPASVLNLFQQKMSAYDAFKAEALIPHILLLGDTGSGKSSFGNLMLKKHKADNHNPFVIEAGTKSATKEIKAEIGNWRGDPDLGKVKVIDTPGKYSSNDERMVQFLRQIGDFYYITTFVLVFNGNSGKFTQADFQLVEGMIRTFGDQILDHLSIVFTNWGMDKHTLKRRRVQKLTEETKKEGFRKLVMSITNANFDRDDAFHFVETIQYELELEGWEVTDTEVQSFMKQAQKMPPCFVKNPQGKILSEIMTDIHHFLDRIEEMEKKRKEGYGSKELRKQIGKEELLHSFSPKDTNTNKNSRLGSNDEHHPTTIERKTSETMIIEESWYKENEPLVKTMAEVAKDNPKYEEYLNKLLFPWNGIQLAYQSKVPFPLNIVHNFKNTLTEFQKVSDTKFQPRIIMMGETGVGKSTFGNVLLGHSIDDTTFTASGSDGGCTQDLKSVDGDLYGDVDRGKITVVDMPGLNDADVDDDKRMKQLMDQLDTISYITTFVLIFSSSNPRFTKAHKKMINVFKATFGIGLITNLVIIFTHWGEDKTSRDRRNRHNILKENRKQGFRKHIDSLFDQPADPPIPCFFLELMDIAAKTETFPCFEKRMEKLANRITEMKPYLTIQVLQLKSKIENEVLDMKRYLERLKEDEEKHQVVYPGSEELRKVVEELEKKLETAKEEGEQETSAVQRRVNESIAYQRVEQMKQLGKVGLGILIITGSVLTAVFVPATLAGAIPVSFAGAQCLVKGVRGFAKVTA